jgi:hypothetical protein
MNTVLNILLTIVALAGLYCAIPSSSRSNNSSVRTQQAVVVADGSDPMPLCRAKRCSQ